MKNDNLVKRNNNSRFKMTEIEKLDSTIAATNRMSSSLKNEDLTNSSILEFLNQEKHCLVDSDNMSELDVESIFDEINRLTVNADDRDVDEILREAEHLMLNNKPLERSLDTSFNCSGSLGVGAGGGEDKESKLSRSASDCNSNQSDDSMSMSKSSCDFSDKSQNNNNNNTLKVSVLFLEFLNFQLDIIALMRVVMYF